jgi:beta-glucanase (GH16 family)
MMVGFKPWVVVIAASIVGCEIGEGPVVEPPVSWIVTMYDEFDGAEGTSPDPAMWTFDVGGDGWGNNQLEFDTDRTENVSHDGNGNLRIVAREEDYMGRAYTSGRIKSKGLVEQKYGRFEARIKLPPGQGIWPAFWMLGANFPETDWPRAGEIDIMEFRGQEPRVVHGTLHGPGYSGGSPITSKFALPEDESFTDDFHIFAVEWDPGRIAFLVDDVVYQVVTTPEVQARGDWVFDHPFFLLLNVAVGGSFVGPVGSDTVFPAEMLVDYVRVFERAPR